MGEPHVIITCEHGGNEIPPEFKGLFANLGELLDSHRGYDPGALETARLFSKSLDAPLYFSTVSRLLIDLNRSLSHKTLFSEITGGLPPAKKKEVIQNYYLPYRGKVESALREKSETGVPVIHLSVHTFTPVLRGEVRACDAGLLYDPHRAREKIWCEAWHRLLKDRLSGFRIRRNYPYHGASDGFTTHLRTCFPSGYYLGLELEINQKFFTDEPSLKSRVIFAVLESFQQMLKSRPLSE